MSCRELACRDGVYLSRILCSSGFGLLSFLSFSTFRDFCYALSSSLQVRPFLLLSFSFSLPKRVSSSSGKPRIYGNVATSVFTRRDALPPHRLPPILSISPFLLDKSPNLAELLVPLLLLRKNPRPKICLKGKIIGANIRNFFKIPNF